MRNLKSRISRVKDSISIVNIVQMHVKLNSRQKGKCPFHSDRDPSLSVSADYRAFRCWSCGAHGDVIEFIKRIHNISFIQALEFLEKEAHLARR